MFTGNIADRISRLLLKLVILIVVWSGVGTDIMVAEEVTSETILAEYKDGKVTKADFEQELYKLPQMFRARYMKRTGKEEFLEGIVLNKISYLKALELGLDTMPETYEANEDLLKPYFSALYRQLEISEKSAVTEDELQQYYYEHSEQLEEPKNTTIRYIQANESDVKEINNTLKIIEKKDRVSDEDSDIELVKKYSTHNYSLVHNGVITNIRGIGTIPGIGKDSSLDNAIIEAPHDKWMGPVKTNTGIHYYKVLKRTESRIKEFSEVEDDLSFILNRNKERKTKKEQLQKLKEKYAIKIDYEKIKSIRLLTLTPDSRELNEIVVHSNDKNLNITIGELYQHFRTVSPYITTEDITSNINYYDHFRYLSQDEWIELTTPEAVERLVNNLVEVNLFDRAARELYLDEPELNDPELLTLIVDPQSSKFDNLVFNHPEVQQLRRHVILKSLFKKLVIDEADPTDDELKKYHQDNIDRFSTKEHRTVRLFLFEDKKEADQARTDVENLIKKYDPEQLEYEVRDIVAKSLYKERNGLLPYIYDSPVLPRFGKDLTMYTVIHSVNLGELSEVHLNDSGLFFFVHYLEHYPAKIYSFDYAKSYLRSTLTYRNRKNRWEELKKELMEEYNVVIYKERLFKVLSAKELFDLAEESQLRRHYIDSISYYDQIIENYPNNDDDYKALFMKAFLIAKELNRQNEAITLFKKLINEYPPSTLHESAKHMIDSLLEEN